MYIMQNRLGVTDDFDDLGPPPQIYTEEIDTEESFPGEQQVIQDSLSKDPDKAMAARALLYKHNVQSSADAKIAKALKAQQEASKKMMMVGGALAVVIILAVVITSRKKS